MAGALKFCCFCESSFIAYPYTLPSTPFLMFGTSTQLIFTPLKYVVECLGAGNYVEGGRECTTLVKVTDPQFGPSKFPLLVSLTLKINELQSEKASFPDI